MEYETKSPLLRLYLDTVKMYKVGVQIHPSHRGMVFLDYLWSWNLNVRFCCSIPSSQHIPQSTENSMPLLQTFVKPFAHYHVLYTLQSVLVTSSVYPHSFSDICLLFENGGLANLYSLAVPPAQVFLTLQDLKKVARIEIIVKK